MRRKLKKAEIQEVTDILMDFHADAECELVHESPFELLIATILSAQCTDVRVNMITQELFKEANTPQAIIDMGMDKLKDYIKTAGFFNSKSKNIMETCNILVDEYDSRVPDTMEELTKLPGVGRKTANVVLSNCFGLPAIAVDTHVFRVSNRIGLVHEKDVEKTEEALMKALPKEIWTKMHHVLIFHGRYICKARKPMCHECPISHLCLYNQNNINKRK